MNIYFLAFIFIYVLSYLLYLTFSKGLGNKAIYLQLRRFLPCALLAILPAYLFNASLASPQYVLSTVVGFSWMFAYPFVYFLTYRKTSPDFGFHLDFVFGMYIIGLLFSLKSIIFHFNIIPSITITLLSIIEVVLLLIASSQWLYYSLYKICVNDEAIMLIRDTDYKEAMEFYKSMPRSLQVILPFAIVALLILFIKGNFSAFSTFTASPYHIILAVCITIFMFIYITKPQKGVFIRTGIAELILDVRKYINETKKYTAMQQERLLNLNVKFNRKFSSKPSTTIIVIGESASRDYMSAFGYNEHNTTPWLKEMSTKGNFILFPNTYSCKAQTVPALENALTEMNQYNDMKFYNACSIIDVAKKAGFRTYWFSNQGHIGSAETSITLMANTTDKAEWTQQNLSQYQHDGSLLQYLKLLDPNENNLVILHLMGSHFNFINRYPYDFAHFSKPGKYDLIPNYLDTLLYTDNVLKSITKYAQDNLNLQMMIYFSDHATTPDKRRSPVFDGFGVVRIPMCVYLSADYIENHQETYTILKSHRNEYFTNDLIYDFFCGLLDIKSNHYNEENSLASNSYIHTKNTLKTDLGNMWIKEDKS